MNKLVVGSLLKMLHNDRNKLQKASKIFRPTI